MNSSYSYDDLKNWQESITVPSTVTLNNNTIYYLIDSFIEEMSKHGLQFRGQPTDFCYVTYFLKVDACFHNEMINMARDRKRLLRVISYL